jgi:peptidoglycan hydrolase-like protein with peptidoglycan-binding domain
MLFASKIACSGIVFLLMTPWISGTRPMPVDSGINLSSEVPQEGDWKNVGEMQQTLQDGGHYSGKIDGVFGLRTRASIRGFQRAEKLPVTGRLDVQTAGKLGVRAERSEDAVYDTTEDKPSAGIEWARGSRRLGKTPLKLSEKKDRRAPR